MDTRERKGGRDNRRKRWRGEGEIRGEKTKETDRKSRGALISDVVFPDPAPATMTRRAWRLAIEWRSHVNVSLRVSRLLILLVILPGLLHEIAAGIGTGFASSRAGLRPSSSPSPSRFGRRDFILEGQRRPSAM